MIKLKRFLSKYPNLKAPLGNADKPSLMSWILVCSRPYTCCVYIHCFTFITQTIIEKSTTFVITWMSSVNTENMYFCVQLLFTIIISGSLSRSITLQTVNT